MDMKTTWIKQGMVAYFGHFHGNKMECGVASKNIKLYMEIAWSMVIKGITLKFESKKQLYKH